MLHGKWSLYRATGFGIVVTHRGSLIGHGSGSPPHWCRTAAAAEAWALVTVLMQCPIVLQMRTDCLSLLHAAEPGPQEATRSKRQLARIWTTVFHMLGGIAHELVVLGKLVWMPAHLSTALVGERKLSDGTRLTNVDWRANRLADILAKQASGRFALPKDVELLLTSAAAAVRFAATSLGRVTHAANNHIVTFLDDKGEECHRRVRDATPAPRTYSKRAESRPPPAPKPPKAATAQPWTEGPAPSANRARLRAEREASGERLQRRLDEIGGSCVVSGRLGSATSRMQAILDRVRGRASGH